MKYREKCSVRKIEAHLATLVNMRWNHFTGNTALQGCVDRLTEDLGTIDSILTRYRDLLQQDSKSKSTERGTPFDPADDPTKSIPSAFRKWLNPATVSLGDNQFFTEVQSSLKVKKNARKLSPFTGCVREAVKNVYRKLRRTNDYVHIALTDQEMGLEQFAENVCNR